MKMEHFNRSNFPGSKKGSSPRLAASFFYTFLKIKKSIRNISECSSDAEEGT